MSRPAVGSRLVALARRDALIQMSYHFNLVYFFVGAVISAFVAYYFSDLVGDAEPLARYEGSYFDFVLLGLALTSYAALGVRAFNEQLAQEQSAGTLEVLLSGSTGLATLLGGGFIVPLALTTVQVTALIGIGVGVFGTGLSLGGVLVAVPVIVLTVVNFCALGIASAALVLLVKRGDPISGPFYQVTLVLSGALFPVELLPIWLEALSKMTPAYYGVRGLREGLLTNGGWAAVTDELLVLAAFAVVSLPLAVVLFARSLATAKRLGVLSSY